VTVPGRQLAPHDRISLSGLATERKVGIGETDCVASMLEDKRGPSLRQNRAAINDANQGLGGAVNDIAAVARHSNQRLRDIQAEIEAGVRALEPTMDTPAGQQMAAFLTGKATVAQAVIDAAQEASASQAASLGGVRARYDTVRE
jgi:hypothetical protein